MNDKKMNEHFEKNKSQNVIDDRHQAVDKAVDNLLQQTIEFHESEHKQRKVLLKVTIGIAALFATFTAILVVAIMIMMPLKQTEPVLITVYEDGHAEIVRDFSKAISFPELVDEKFLSEYVVMRETYDWHKLQYIVDYTKAWSAEHVYKEFYNYVTMPNGVLTTLADKGRIDVSVTSAVVDKDNGVAVIRLVKKAKKADGEVMTGIPETYWIAELKYEMTGKQVHKERKLNPFGYKVVSYTLTQELTR